MEINETQTNGNPRKNLVFRSSHRWCSVKKGVHKDFTNFFFCEIREMFKYTYCEEHL